MINSAPLYRYKCTDGALQALHFSATCNQNVYLYFIENRKKFAIEYLLGMSYLQRHGDIIYKNILVYAPILLFLYFMNHISWKLSVICILISILFEFLTFYVLIRKFENKRIIEILKGE